MTRQPIWLVAVVALVLLATIGAGLWFTVTLGEPFGRFPPQGVFVEIPRGASVREIAGQLEDHRVVRDARAFELLARWRGRPLQAGEYKFDAPRTGYEVHEMLAAGRVFLQPLVIPEGKTMFEVAALVEQAGFGSRDTFLEAARDASRIRELGPRAGNLEGFLFPATYQFPRRTPAGEIAGTMVRRFREVWNKLPNREQPPRGLSALELVTLASLIERETGVAGERPLIAAVFYNRLRRGMALECDPTVIYALTLADRYRGTLYRRDLKFNSPYNTYRHRGLPPGPIASPGEAALRAALEPATTDYLYFVADAQGGHLFSSTLREHNSNVARYRRLMASDAPDQERESKPAGARSPKSRRAGGSR